MVALVDAIREGRLNAEAAVVVSNMESASGLAKARDRGVDTVSYTHLTLPTIYSV